MEATSDLRMIAAIVENSVLGYAVLDPESSTIRYVNAAMAEQVGATVTELLGSDPLDLIHPDERAQAAHALEERLLVDDRLRDIGVPVAMRVQRRDGTTAMLEIGTRDHRDDPDVRGLVVRTRPMRGQEHLHAGLHQMARGAPTRQVLVDLVQAVDGVIEDGFSAVAVRSPNRCWTVPDRLDPTLALLARGADGLLPAVWDRARASGDVEVVHLDEVEPHVAAAARAAGYSSCWVLAVPSASIDSCIVIWRVQRRVPLVSARIELGHIADAVGLAIERERSMRELEHAARHDLLTGLANRSSMMALLEETANSETDGDELVGVLFVDLDDFKSVNDRHGHAVGDALLKEVAGRIVAAVRVGDTVARLGGDEFAVLCPRVAGEAEAERIAERIVRGLSHPFHAADERVVVGGSVGVVLHRPGAKAPPGLDGVAAGDRLLAAADQAMYEAKRAGRGRWAVHRTMREAGGVR